MIVTKNVTCEEENLVLTNQRAMYWESEKMLILSDLHIGKTAHFRKNGLAIPRSVMKKDLSRLDELIPYFDTKQILITGDLLHAGKNSDLDFFIAWRKNHAEIKITLVPGNHDRIEISQYEKMGVEVVDETFHLAPFTFCHSCDQINDGFYISGHIHPGVSIKGKGRQSLRLPCFILNEGGIILPAFSEFTGLYTVEAQHALKVYAFTSNEIFSI